MRAQPPPPGGRTGTRGARATAPLPVPAPQLQLSPSLGHADCAAECMQQAHAGRRLVGTTARTPLRTRRGGPPLTGLAAMLRGKGRARAASLGLNAPSRSQQAAWRGCRRRASSETKAESFEYCASICHTARSMASLDQRAPAPVLTSSCRLHHEAADRAARRPSGVRPEPGCLWEVVMGWDGAACEPPPLACTAPSGRGAAPGGRGGPRRLARRLRRGPPPRRQLPPSRNSNRGRGT